MKDWSFAAGSCSVVAGNMGSLVAVPLQSALGDSMSSLVAALVHSAVVGRTSSLVAGLVHSAAGGRMGSVVAAPVHSVGESMGSLDDVVRFSEFSADGQQTKCPRRSC